jgi:hypothetical protein
MKTNDPVIDNLHQLIYSRTGFNFSKSWLALIIYSALVIGAAFLAVNLKTHNSL